jgi:hypothetical protein
MGETNRPDDHSFGQTFQTKLVEPTSVVYQLINPLKQCFGRSDVAHKVLMTLATTKTSVLGLYETHVNPHQEQKGHNGCVTRKSR